MSRYVASGSRVYGPNSDLIAPAAVQAPDTLGGPSATRAGVENAPVPITQLFAGWKDTFLGAPLFWLAMLVLFLLAWKLVEEHRGGEAAFSKIRVDGTNIVKSGVMAMVFFIIAKYFARAYEVPGVSHLVLSA